ncbi:DUF1176 domain-containing protein [Pseudoduganella umbonata]|uniref:DUF1176 domain-containing protein n=2 Tax=Pseudoduganella umbonata TaxID=864828 RepID=A0A7W5H9X6_9BURK|nr:DUF1176 domain-containing protein [Pseudoduganella umbonata]MBB3220615.1 hypothetical protein [Pseudoduganella umbonata]
MTVKTAQAAVVALALLASGSAVMAAEPHGIAFVHHDWELACDNTRTCRAAGYHPQPNDEDDGDSDTDTLEKALPVSVLLTRKAGPHQPVVGELHIGHYGEETTESFPGKRSLTLLIDTRPVGQVTLARGHWIASLAPGQTAALLAALPGHGNIQWTDGKRTWKLSNKGAAAVMLKMDEFQGRLDTPGALLAKGTRDERDVLPAVPAPVVVAPGVPADADRVRLSTPDLAALRQALAASSGDECSALADPAGGHSIHMRRLSRTRLLASTTCWAGASDVAEAYWTTSAMPPFAATLVTTNGRAYLQGKIDASRWAGGFDCMDIDEWTWDGKRFVQTRKGTTGMCRGIDMGGAWSLPVIVTDVRPAPVRP